MATDLYDQIAGILGVAQAGTETWIAEFHEEQGDLPTAAAVAQTRLSLVQVGVRRAENLELGPDYANSGRVEIRDRDTSRRLVLRSESAARIERDIRAQESLFDSAQYQQVTEEVLIYALDSEGVDLFIAGAVRRENRQHLFVSSEPMHVGFRSFAVTSIPPFSQGEVGEAFEDLGHDEINEGTDE